MTFTICAPSKHGSRTFYNHACLSGLCKKVGQFFHRLPFRFRIDLGVVAGNLLRVMSGDVAGNGFGDASVLQERSRGVAKGMESDFVPLAPALAAHAARLI